MDKHLKHLIKQTERYTGMLADNMKRGGSVGMTIKRKHRDSTASKPMRTHDSHDEHNTHDPDSGETDDISSDEDFFDDEEEMDDETTLLEEESRERNTCRRRDCSS